MFWRKKVAQSLQTDQYNTAACLLINVLSSIVLESRIITRKTMRPIPLNALAKRFNLKQSAQTLVTGVAIDSRKIEPGDLFFALPGNRVDGHDFLREAALKGASGAVVLENYHGEEFNLPMIRVSDVLVALQECARKSLELRSSKVIAITGSLGKTTTKEFVASLLKSKYKIFASPLSYNSQATVPLSILMADENEDFLILEMGMTHEGNIKNLVSIAPPDLAVITTVALQHVCNFPDGLSGICREKASIFSHPHTEWGLLPADIHHFEKVLKIGGCKKMTFSTTSNKADFYLCSLDEEKVRIYEKGTGYFDLQLNLPMKTHQHNFLAAVAVARKLNVEWDLIREASPFLKLPAMRFEPVSKQGILFINDAYNANPDAMRAALENLPKAEKGCKVIAVLGEMDALGAYSEAGHALVAEAALHYADSLLCLGPSCEVMQKIWKREKRNVQLFQTRSDLEEALKALAKPGDVVLLKGARVHALDEILNQYD